MVAGMFTQRKSRRGQINSAPSAHSTRGVGERIDVALGRLAAFHLADGE